MTHPNPRRYRLSLLVAGMAAFSCSPLIGSPGSSVLLNWLSGTSLSAYAAEEAALENEGDAHAEPNIPDKPATGPAVVNFKNAPPAPIPAVSYGPPPWAPKRKVATAMPVAGGSPAAARSLEIEGVELENRLREQKATINVRLVKHYHLPPADTVMAYPWPVRPPRPAVHNKLSEKPQQLKPMILASGYSNRIDFNRPYPLYGWRWVHAFLAAHEKSGLGYPHTFLTIYPWVNSMMPYVLTEVKRVNALEASRLEAYRKVLDEFERTHVEIENEASAKGLVPVEIKVDRHGIGQSEIPAGNWWISATRKLPDIKFYWQVPLTVSAGQTVNVQLTNQNAIVVQGRLVTATAVCLPRYYRADLPAFGCTLAC